MLRITIDVDAPVGQAIGIKVMGLCRREDGLRRLAVK